MSEALPSASIEGGAFGHRLRHLRRRAGLTLAQLGARVGRPAPYLSRVENGHVEPRLSLVGELARSLGCAASELLDPTPPTRRAALEIELARAQRDSRYAALKLPAFRPSVNCPDEALAHCLGLWRAYTDASASAPGAPADPVRRANARLRAEMRECDNYFGEIEDVAAEGLKAVGYSGSGPLPERSLLDLTAHFGFGVERVMDLPRSTRSVTDLRHRVIYVPQRNQMRTRSARSAVLSTLGHFALRHSDPADLGDYLRQRVESNYFAGAVLAPESAAVPFLRQARDAGDLSPEDFKEVFYVSYEMAAHRLTNLATRHLDIPLHFLRTDDEGIVTKAYENDGLPLPGGRDGAPEGQQVPDSWGPRQVFRSDDTYALHYQFTETSGGEYWCVTHVETGQASPYTLTLGTVERYARFFRGGDTGRRIPADSDARTRGPATAESRARWKGHAWPSPRDREFVLEGLPGDSEGFEPFPGVAMSEVYDFLERHTS